jgi:hypothetical protein
MCAAAAGSWLSRARSRSHRVAALWCSAAQFLATPNSQSRSWGGDGTWPNRRQATVKTWATTSSAASGGTRRRT